MSSEPRDIGASEKSQTSTVGADPLPVARGDAKKGRARAKTPEVGSVRDFLQAVYSGKAKRTKLKASELAALRSGPRLQAGDRQNLLVLARSDQTLDKTLELMLFRTTITGEPVLAAQIRDFASDVLQGHPAFRVGSLSAALANRPDGPSEEEALKILASQQYHQLSWPEGCPPLKKKEVETCRRNAVGCLLLCFRETRGTTVERIQKYLTVFWRGLQRRDITDSDKLRILMRSRDPAGVAVSSAVLEKQASDAAMQAAAAREGEQRAIGQLAELEAAKGRLESELQAEQEKTQGLANEAARLRQRHEDEKSHLQDDLEQVRGRVLRRLREEVSLLDEGLHALRREPPKVHVMQDHAERAIEGLKREIERLMGDQQ